MTRWLILIVAAGCALAASLSASLAAAPRRVVSFNLCADQLVLALADREQIAGLSPYAADPMLSIVAGKAKEFRRLDWQAESTIPLNPDLVFVGSWDRPATRRMLQRLGFRVVAVDLVADLDAAKAQIRDVAALLGHPERAAPLLAALDEARQRVRAAADPSFATALVVERGGYIAGSDTLVSTLLKEAGLTPPRGAPRGYGGFLPLERLLTLQPDLLFIKDPPRAPQDQGSLYFTHPALEALYPPRRRIALPTRFTMCGGPALVAAFDYLAEAMKRLKN
jgi:iron complex transport system substrate-binding protein